MNDQDLKQLWREQKMQSAPALAPDQLTAAMREKMALLHRRLNTRDRREFGGAAVVLIAFGIYYFIFPQFLARLGGALVMAGTIFASVKMFYASRPAPPPLADAPVADWLKQELAQVQRQAELLRTVFWWYLLPPYIGSNIFVAGLPNASVFLSVIYAMFSGLLYLWVYWLNQRVRRKQLLPLERELNALLPPENSPHDKL